MKYVSPSIRETAFNCPHCGALAKQYWYNMHATSVDNEKKLPLHIPQDDARNFDFEEVKNEEARKRFAEHFKRLKEGAPFFDVDSNTLYRHQNLYNVHISRCFNCNDIAIWIYDKLVYPQRGEAPSANDDLPKEIREDYDEASTILDLSPRGAAALVRLCIQKLCKHLGQPGKNLNDDIAALVRDGLDSRVQKALDAVRVIGNNAVHPGAIDLKDDRPTAESLFRLLNVIAEKMISEPKHVDDVFENLPPNAKAQIEARDKKKA